MSLPWATIIVAAGSGQRFGSEMLKQYAPLCGKAVLAYSLETFTKYGPVALVVNPAHAPHVPAFAPISMWLRAAIQGRKAFVTAWPFWANSPPRTL
jgi:2-C-methyl-D-erythritol 4-phosphate cytidylyltransferase